MLRHTFCHLPGIGPKTEQNLWQAGVTSWDAFLAQCSSRSHRGRRSWPEHMQESLRHLETGNPAYFSQRLPANQSWRLFRDFRHTCAYIDIETTGLGNPGDHITTIALYDGTYLRCYVHGINLDEFPRDIQKYKLLVTYNGSGFDLPFLERHFRITLDHAHIDLRYVLRSLGYSGGLKRCEQLLGIDRPGLQDVDGYVAVLLWQEYRKHKESRALETLLAYNVQDTINLEILMVEAFQRKVGETPFAAAQPLPAAARPENPYTPDADLLARALSSLGWRLPLPR